jgi:hypothetical protein
VKGWLFLLLAASTPAVAADLGGLPFDPSQFPDPNSLVSQAVVNAIVKLVGLGIDHRPMMPATALGTQFGVELGLEVTLVKVPGDFFSTLQANGFPAGSSPLPSLPVAKLHLHKGIGSRLDVGGAFFYLSSAKVFSADAKFVVFQPEEGPSVAVRGSYNYTDFSFSGANVSTKTFTPEVLISREMEFADPYLGLGASYTLGTMDATLPLPAPLPAQKVSAGGNAYGALLFGGVVFRIPNTGLRLTVEGAYSTADLSYLGVKIGFGF